MSHTSLGQSQKLLLESELQVQPSLKFDAGTLFVTVGNTDAFDTHVKVRSLDPGDSSICQCRRTLFKELTTLEAFVLLPVKPVRNRLKICRDEKWFKEIPIIAENKRVLVQDKGEGLVKFKGVVKDYGPGPGIRFVVEIQDGTDDLIKRQQCMTIHDIRLLDGCDVPNGPSSLSAPKLPSKKKSLPPTPRDLHHSSTACATSSAVPTQKDSCPIEVNDKVVWVSDHGPEYGTVRWLGHLHDTSPDLMVGVEFVNRVGTGTGKYRERQLFEAKLGHASLVPVLGLLRAEDYQCEQDTVARPSSSNRPEARFKIPAMLSGSLDRKSQFDNSAEGSSNERSSQTGYNNVNPLYEQCQGLNTAVQGSKEDRHPQTKPEKSPRSTVPNRTVDGVRFSKHERSPLGKYDLDKMLGRGKGIQGHHNSCYLDATLFAMFACTDVFDSILYRERRSEDIDRYDDVRRVLKDDIVNPLRKEQYVPHGNVMKLRHLLDQLSNVSGLTTEEKDPEEFLNSLTQILMVEPFLFLSSGQQTHLYQLFVEKDKFLEIPTVQQLFHQSIFESNIKFKKVPSKLIIQMPRFGRQFKVYSRILPSLKLDITDLLENSPRFCFVCGRLAAYECRQCFRADIGLEGICYCKHCIKSVHKHPDREGHKSDKLGNIPGFSEGSPTARTCMDLFAVVCIETSHYVCFVKCGDDDSAPWCFFDSMADREGCEDGYNIPEVQEFHDFHGYVGESGIAKLQEITDDKLLPVMGRKLVCDAYMCMYLNKTARQYE